MLRVTLLCHGATAANRRAAFPADEPLEARAVAASRALGGSLRATEVRSSPERRALQTAEALGLAARIDSELRDCDYGHWTGQDMKAVLEREPEDFTAFMIDPEARPHGGESIFNLSERIAAWLDALLAAQGQILAITHASVVRAAVLTVLSAPLEAFLRIDVPPLSTTELVCDGQRWVWRAAQERGA